MVIETVQDLLDALEDVDPDTPVRLAMQVHFPMAGHLVNVCIERDEGGDPQAAWLACSGHEGYGCPRAAWTKDEFRTGSEDGE